MICGIIYTAFKLGPLYLKCFSTITDFLLAHEYDSEHNRIIRNAVPNSLPGTELKVL